MCAPTTVVKVLHAEAAHIFNKGLDLLVFLHRFIIGVVNVHHVRHKTAKKENSTWRGNVKSNQQPFFKFCTLSYFEYTNSAI